MAKTYTTVIDKAGGDTFSEAMWDTYIKDNINNLIVPPMAIVRHNVDQAIATATETAIAMNLEDVDNDGMHDTVTNNSRITPTTLGTYLVTLNLYWAANATGARLIYIFFNDGAKRLMAAQADITASASFLTPLSCSSMQKVTSTSHYFYGAGYQSSGGNLNVLGNDPGTPRFTALWVGKDA